MTEPNLKPYEAQLHRWLPALRVERANGPMDAVARWRTGRHFVTYLLEHKRHLEHQDARAIAQQLLEYRRQYGRGLNTRILLVAPFIRREQGTVLEQNDIDYVDLAGNAHLRAPGLFVHVEGVRPTRKPVRVHRRMTRGWAKTVMALLMRPELIQEPYRPIAAAAAVAPATVMACLADLHRNGFVHRVRGTRQLDNVHELVALWVQAYVEVLRPKLTQRNFQAKLADKHERWRCLHDALARRDIRWALTGVDAALQIDPHLRADQTELYADPAFFEDRDLLQELQLQPAVTGNVQVIEPPVPLVLDIRAETAVPVAPILLVYAELRYRNNDQANEAAELLLPEVLKRAKA